MKRPMPNWTWYILWNQPHKISVLLKTSSSTSIPQNSQQIYWWEQQLIQCLNSTINTTNQFTSTYEKTKDNLNMVYPRNAPISVTRCHHHRPMVAFENNHHLGRFWVFDFTLFISWPSRSIFTFKTCYNVMTFANYGTNHVISKSQEQKVKSRPTMGVFHVIK